MPIITDVKVQVRNRDKVSIFVDGKYGFSLSLNQVNEFRDLKISSELTPQRLVELKKISQTNNLYLQILNLIYIRPRSEYEVRTKLKSKKIDPDEIDQLITKLNSENNLNDQNFATWWINSRKNSKPISALKLRAELAQKGIKPQLAQQALIQNFSQDEELEALEKLVNKKKGRYESEQKLMAFLASRGFSYDLIKKVLEEEDSF